jgi:hypothetical protein
MIDLVDEKASDVPRLEGQNGVLFSALGRMTLG